MIKVKNTLRSTVHLTHDGRVIKQYHGKDAFRRFAREVKVLKHLEGKGCGFVPRLLESDRSMLQIVTTNCGMNVEHLEPRRSRAIFKQLEAFGVRHDDQNVRNIMYRPEDGRFYVIDFEFAQQIHAHSSAASVRN